MTPRSTESSLKQLGLKNTRIRQQILKIFSLSREPVDALYLTEKVNANKTSIYRELQTLLSKHIISEIDFGEGKKRYELSSLDHHHHLICINCKSIKDINLSEDLGNQEKVIEKTTSFKVFRHHLEFFGLCSDCSKKPISP